MTAPAINRMDIVVVPSVSNFANPYGYFSEGGLRERRQQNRVTKSPRRSTSGSLVYARHSIHDVIEYEPLIE